jgi:hypothetical protein
MTTTYATTATPTDRDTFLHTTNDANLGNLTDHYNPDTVPATHQAMLDELHDRALEDAINRPHLVSLRAASRHLATLIREDNLDGEDIAALQNADFDGVAPRHYAGAGERTYRFLCEASDTFERHGDLLLRTATVAILGW